MMSAPLSRAGGDVSGVILVALLGVWVPYIYRDMD